MSENDSATALTRIPVSPETRDLVRAQKRGGESYDELLYRMVDQYDPEEVSIDH